MKKEITNPLAKEIQEIMAMFYEVNPAINFANKTQRSSAEWMIKKWGIETVKNMTTKVLSCQGEEYAPVASNPYEMKEKLFKFKLFFERNNKPKPKIYEG